MSLCVCPCIHLWLQLKGGKLAAFNLIWPSCSCYSFHLCGNLWIMSSSCDRGGKEGMNLRLWLMQGVCLLSGVWVTPAETKECGVDLHLNSRPCHPPVIVRVSGLTWDSPDCHFWMFRSLLTRRPGARAVVCILMTDSHISIVLIPANIISTEGFISWREKKKATQFLQVTSH